VGEQAEQEHLTTAQRCRSETEKNLLEDLFSPVLSQFKQYHPTGNLKLSNLGIFQGLRFRISMKKNVSNFSSAKFHSKKFGLLWVKTCRSMMRL